tara:strand:- start:4764 stop:4910 length:147 start_codon:yes stop_codon:yes gene_type:complete
MNRLIVPFITFFILFWVGGNVLSAGLQIAKANADRLADTMCEVTSDCL